MLISGTLLAFLLISKYLKGQQVSESFFFLRITLALSSMSTSKKARMSSPADDEMKELWGKNGGRVLCDGLANSLKTTRNKTGYRYVYPVGGTYRGTHSFFAKVHDIKAGKQVSLG